MLRWLKSVILPLFLVCVASLPVILAYFHSGYPFTHDGMAVVIRLADMLRSLHDGQFPVRYSGYLNHGYGYPLFNFVYPFPYYLGALIRLIFRSGLVDTTKIIFLASVPVSAIFMFLAAKKLWQNSWAAILCSLLYVYLPFRIVNLYVRGSIGESLGTIFYPLVIWLGLNLESKHSRLVIALTAVSFAALIPTHNITAVYGFILFGFFLVSLLLARKFRQASLFLISLLLGFGLSAFFYMPALLEKNYILLSKIPIANREIYFARLSDLWIPKWGFGVPNQADGFGYQLGWPHFVILVLVLLLLAYKFARKRNIPADLPSVLSFSYGLLSLILIFLLLPVSSSVWKVTLLLTEVNYPWTLLAPLGFIVSLLSGWLWQFSKARIFTVVLTMMAIILLLPHVAPQSYLDLSDSSYLTNDATTTSSDELMPLWAKTKPDHRSENKVEVASGSGTISNLISNSRQIRFQADFRTDSPVLVNMIYFPGWAGFVDKDRIPLTYNNPRGLIQLSVPAGHHSVQLRLEDTPIRKIGNIISLLSLLVLFVVLLANKTVNVNRHRRN